MHALPEAVAEQATVPLELLNATTTSKPLIPLLVAGVQVKVTGLLAAMFPDGVCGVAGATRLLSREGT